MYRLWAQPNGGCARTGDGPWPWAGGYVLDNGVIRAGWTAPGLLVSLVDHASGREAIAPGQPGNLLELHRDTPNEWDAWDIDEFYRRNVTPLTEATSVRRPPTGRTPAWWWSGWPARSPVTQHITLAAGSPALSITTSVDWQEREKLLELGFGLDIRADRSAAETQFGHVFRPTHTNTSWEAAKFEVCAHRWIPRRRARLRGGSRQLVHLRPRRHQERQGRRRDHHHRPVVPGAGSEVP